MLRSAFSQKPAYEFFLGRRQQGQRKVPLHFWHVHVELSNLVVRSVPEDARYLSKNGSESHSFFVQPIIALAWPGRKVWEGGRKLSQQITVGAAVPAALSRPTQVPLQKLP